MTFFLMFQFLHKVYWKGTKILDGFRAAPRRVTFTRNLVVWSPSTTILRPPADAYFARWPILFFIMNTTIHFCSENGQTNILCFWNLLILVMCLLSGKSHKMLSLDFQTAPNSHFSQQNGFLWNVVIHCRTYNFLGGLHLVGQRPFP